MEGDNYMFNVGDKIVYPMHGAGTIDAIEEKRYLRRKTKLLYNQNAWRSKGYGSNIKSR